MVEGKVGARMKSIVVALIVLGSSIGVLLWNSPGRDFANTFLSISLTYLLTVKFVTHKGFRWAAFCATTWYRRRDIRVSIAYLVAIRVQGAYLLVRGHRIRHQYQPVGGVFKVAPRIWQELINQFQVQQDVRFAADETAENDLRLVVKGRHLGNLLAWFMKGENIEVAPWREFHEELIAAGHLSRVNFSTAHFERVGLRTDGIHFDPYTRLQQLIVVELYKFFPTADQEMELRMLKDGGEGGMYPEFGFFNADLLKGGAKVPISEATFDVAPTCKWLTSIH